MNAATLIQKNMDATHRRWKWLKFGQYLGTSGAVISLLWLAMQVAAHSNVLSEVWIFYCLLTLLITCALFSLLLTAIVAFGAKSKRTWIASALEKGCPGLMDRVNTLVFLEGEYRRRPQWITFKKKLEEQAADVMQKEKAASPFSPTRTFQHLAVFALALAAVIAFQIKYNPFDRLLHPPPVTAAATPKNDSPFELAAQNVTEPAEKKTWGEVKIVDPGHDVKLHKIDVLPLQIEMAASGSMDSPQWITSINGEPETPHPLAAPSEPNYAVYQPMVYLDELKVEDWDVVSYYAKVHTDAPGDYSSKINFIEIRPFRDDILKSTGSKDGKGNSKYQLLSELSGLIHQQTDVLQQTHQHQQTTYTQDELRLQDAKKLTAAESNLSVATDHLFAEFAAMENMPVGDILDHLGGAQQQMDKATEALRDDVAEEGKQREQGALAQLIACRKTFQKQLNNGGNSNGGGGSPDDDTENPVVTAKDSLKAMSQVSEVHDRDKAALADLHDLEDRQQNLANNLGNSSVQANVQAENKLKDDFHRLTTENPELFRDADNEKGAVQVNMTRSVLSASSNDSYNAKRDMTHAADSIRDLEKVANKNHETQQLAEAYKLKKIIDQNIQQLGQEKDKPGTMSPDDAKALAESAERSAGTLKDINDNATGTGFGPELGKALSPENQQALHDALDKFAQSQPGSDRGTSAGTAQQGLQNISKAFDQSQPDLTKQLRGQDQLQPSPSDALNQASQQLQGLILADKDKKASPEDEAKAQAEILHDLEIGLLDPKDPNPSKAKAELAAKIEDELKPKPGMPVDPERLKKLLDEIEAVRIEANDPNRGNQPLLDTTFVDPSKFPPTYRERIQKYYEQLSTHPQ